MVGDAYSLTMHSKLIVVQEFDLYKVTLVKDPECHSVENVFSADCMLYGNDYVISKTVLPSKRFTFKHVFGFQSVSLNIDTDIEFKF